MPTQSICDLLTIWGTLGRIVSAVETSTLVQNSVGSSLCRPDTSSMGSLTSIEAQLSGFA
jgi:hypothetical protein